MTNAPPAERERAPGPIRRIPKVPGLCAEHIVWRGSAPTGPAVLVDQLGRAHAVAATTTVGREPGTTGLVVLESSVSRRHAELALRSGAWEIRDLGSTNGTFVEGHRVRTPVPLPSGGLVVMGDVGFLFYEDGDGATAVRDTEGIRATAAASVRAPAHLVLSEPSGGGGGNVEYLGHTAQLGETQFALVTALAERALAEGKRPDDVRGFIHSTELLAELPFNTPYPTVNHLKQLVRRTRRSLERIGLVDAIESRQRYGYRLLVAAVFRS